MAEFELGQCSQLVLEPETEPKFDFELRIG